MTLEAQALVLRGLNRALALQVSQLFDVLLCDASEEGIERFMRGLDKAVDAHERLVGQLGLNGTTSPDEYADGA